MKKQRCLYAAGSLLLILTSCTHTSDSLRTMEENLDHVLEAPAGSANGTISGEEVSGEVTDLLPFSLAGQTVTLPEQVIWDTEELCVTVQGMKETLLSGPSISLFVENRSQKNLTLQAVDGWVNRYMVDTYFSENIPAGQTSACELYFDKSTMNLCGITDVAEAGFTLHVFDTKHWDDYTDSDPVILETSACVGFTDSFQRDGDTLYEENGVYVASKGITETDPNIGKQLLLVLDNAGESEMVVASDTVLVNGVEIVSVFSEKVLAGKHAVCEMILPAYELKRAGIEEIESVTLSFRVMTGGEEKETTPITLNF